MCFYGVLIVYGDRDTSFGSFFLLFQIMVHIQVQPNQTREIALDLI